MAAQSYRRFPRSADDNRGWFRRALAALPASGIVLGSLALTATG